MNERDKLISRLKILIDIHTAKQKKYQEENKLSSDVGCITREAYEIAELFPQVLKLGITLDDLH